MNTTSIRVSSTYCATHTNTKGYGPYYADQQNNMDPITDPDTVVIPDLTQNCLGQTIQGTSCGIKVKAPATHCHLHLPQTENDDQLEDVSTHATSTHASVITSLTTQMTAMMAILQSLHSDTTSDPEYTLSPPPPAKFTTPTKQATRSTYQSPTQRKQQARKETIHWTTKPTDIPSALTRSGSPKFDTGDNVHNFKRDICMFTPQWKHCLNLEPEPPENHGEPTNKGHQWYTALCQSTHYRVYDNPLDKYAHDNEVMANCILVCLSPAARLTAGLDSTGNARQILDILEKANDQSGTHHRQASLSKDIIDFEFDAAETVQTNENTLQQLRADHARSGAEPIPESIIITLLMNTLEKVAEFQLPINILRQQSTAPVSISAVFSAIRFTDESRRRKSETAMQAKVQHSPSKTHTAKGLNVNPCKCCGMNNHSTQKCYGNTNNPEYNEKWTPKNKRFNNVFQKYKSDHPKLYLHQTRHVEHANPDTTMDDAHVTTPPVSPETTRKTISSLRKMFQPLFMVTSMLALLTTPHPTMSHTVNNESTHMRNGIPHKHTLSTMGAQHTPKNNGRGYQRCLVDTGASSTYVPSVEGVHDLHNANIPITLGDGSTIRGIATGWKWMQVQGDTTTYIRVPVIVCNKIQHTIISPHSIVYTKHQDEFKHNGTTFDPYLNGGRFQYPDGHTIQLKTKNKLPWINMKWVTPPMHVLDQSRGSMQTKFHHTTLNSAVEFAKHAKPLTKIHTNVEIKHRVTSSLLHQAHVKFGHLNLHDTIEILERMGITLSNRDRVLACKSCLHTKATRKRRHQGTSIMSSGHTTRFGQVIHADLIQFDKSTQGYKYALILTDDFSRFVHAIPLRKKSDTANEFRLYLTNVLMKHLPENVVYNSAELHTDPGGEFKSAEFRSVCAAHKITITMCPPRHPNSNAIAERINKTLKQMVAAMIQNSNKSKQYWPLALQHACVLRNRQPTSGNPGRETPLERLQGEYGLRSGHYLLSRLQPWGIPAIVLNESKSAGASKTRSGWYAGVNPETQAPKIVMNDTNRIVESVDVTFLTTNEFTIDSNQYIPDTFECDDEIDTPEQDTTTNQTEAMKTLYHEQMNLLQETSQPTTNLPSEDMSTAFTDNDKDEAEGELRIPIPPVTSLQTREYVPPQIPGHQCSGKCIHAQSLYKTTTKVEIVRGIRTPRTLSEALSSPQAKNGNKHIPQSYNLSKIIMYYILLTPFQVSINVYHSNQYSKSKLIEMAKSTNSKFA